MAENTPPPPPREAPKKLVGKVLFVDDETSVLDSIRRLHRKRFDMDTATGPHEALEMVRTTGPYAVVVSDYKMPQMDGIELLTRIHTINADTVRIMLTGQADLNASIEAVNRGHVFRFLTKPCPDDVLVEAVTDGIRQHRLVTGERELLRGTLRGAVKVLTEILSLVNPEAFGKGERIKRFMRRLGKRLEMQNIWQLELMAMLSQIGCVMLDEEILRKKARGQELGPEERQIFDMHPSVAANLLANIPRMEEVADAILHQTEDLSTNPRQRLPAQLLKLLLDYDDLVESGKEKPEVFAILKSRTGLYDPKVLHAFEKVAFEEEGWVPKALPLTKLHEGMLLAADVKATTGQLILAKGKEISQTTLVRLRAFAKAYGIIEPLHVQVPMRPDDDDE